MNTDELSGFRTARELREECDRLGCHRHHDGRVILAAADRVSRQLCDHHQRKILGVSS